MANFTKNFDHLPNLHIFLEDCDHIDCAIYTDSGMIGQTWQVAVALTGPLDDNFFISDFGDIKHLVKRTLRKSIDHTLIIPNTLNTHETENLSLRFPNGWNYFAPKGAVSVIPFAEVNQETITQFLNQTLQAQLPQDYHISISLHQTQYQNGSYFSYTHGIQGHQGNCQRLLHGHQGKIRISIKGQRQVSLEQKFLSFLTSGQSIHIASASQVASQSDDLVELSYLASQGRFHMTLPRPRTLILPTGTSIEAITLGLANIFQKKFKPSSTVEMTCFEGIGKGSTTLIHPDHSPP